MKKTVIVVLATILMGQVMAQHTMKYTAFVYTNESLSFEIEKQYNQMQTGDKTKDLGEDLALAALNAAKGIASGYVSSAFDLGIKTIANLMTRNERLHDEWKQTVDAENTFETRISSISEMSDFYSALSTDGALDPRSMRFDGIGCLRMEGKDTVFYISMHIDKSKLDRIVRHSKFELVLDTLIVSPYHSGLPNSSFDTVFSYKDRTNFAISLSMQISSSWMDQLPQMHKDQLLGEFKLNVPVKQTELDSTGFLRYVRNGNEPAKYVIVGESFIVPRSYTGVTDKKSGELIYGTGEYNLSITLKESCSLTSAYKDNWKNNRKQRKKVMGNSDNLFVGAWRTVTSQKWDELAQQWVITILQAPANILEGEMIDKMNLNPSTN